MAPTAVLTPFIKGAASQVGTRLWRKRVLPVGTINYKGRVLTFDKGYNDELARAFAAGAYDQVPFQLADAQNTHTNDPERYRGSIVDMRSEPDGLWITLAPTADGEAAILKNPGLGVSARIVENYDRADGQFFPRAVQHVLGTLDPRITGLGAWQAIEASNTPEMVIDLTGEAFAGQGNGGTMAELTEQQRARLARLLDIPEDQFAQLVGDIRISDADLDGLGASEEEIADAELDDILAQLSPQDIAALEAEMDAEYAAAGQATGLSSQAVMAIEMANARADEAVAGVSRMASQLDEREWQAERIHLIRDVGVPPHLVDLGQDLLKGTGHVVDLSNGTHVDAGRVVRQILSEVGKLGMMGGLGIELGSPLDEPEGVNREQRHAEVTSIVSRARSQMGL